jgi:(1->4)-alpha-D-glucan 1-alpha-D-glucosylmutase
MSKRRCDRKLTFGAAAQISPMDKALARLNLTQWRRAQPTVSNWGRTSTFARPPSSRRTSSILGAATSGAPPSDVDRGVISAMVAKAKARCADCDSRLFDFLEGLLVTPCEVTLRFQQVSGPVSAKSVEDTAFFDHHRFIALNDVGNDPDVFGTSSADFHAYNLAKHRDTPLAMLATTTHDTKRSEDVRARLAVVSEIPGVWRDWVSRVRRLTDRYRGSKVDAGIEYHLYQTLAGVWPIDGDRLAKYVEKAMREAKNATSWLNVNVSYETAMQTFATRLLGDPEVRRELDDLLARIGPAGEENALAQKLLTLTSPGVPDRYQGSERWYVSLVDPDNRRPVDFARPEDVKTTFVRKVLAVRREYPQCFDERGTYTPMFEEQPRIVAYRRGERVLVIAQRLRRTPLEVDLTLPEGRWTNVFSGDRYDGRIPWRSCSAMLLVRD